MYRTLLVALASAMLALAIWQDPAESACALVAGKGRDVHQPGQHVYLHWDPQKQVETLILQPRLESTTPDFGIVVPTPTKPEVVTVPREFFGELAVFTTLYHRTFPISRLKDPPPDEEIPKRGTKIKVLAEGMVGTRSCKIVTADQAEELAVWLKENHYDIGGPAVLEAYVKKKWCFTLLKSEPARMRKQADGIFAGEIEPIGLSFSSTAPIVPLRAACLGVKDQLDVLFYIDAPVKMDLPGEGSYQFQWVPLLVNARPVYPKGRFRDGDLPGKADGWLKSIEGQVPALLKKGQELGFGFTNKSRPQPNKQGRVAATLEWAKRLTADDGKLLEGKAAYSERILDPDEGFGVADVKNDRRREAVFKVIQRRLDRSYREHPAGFLVRAAPAEDVARLKELSGRLTEGRFLTKFRKVFTRAEMTDDLVLVPARVAGVEDNTEYTEFLPTSPP